MKYNIIKKYKKAIETIAQLNSENKQLTKDSSKLQNKFIQYIVNND